MDYAVYRITNIINDMMYFGSTKDFQARKKQHLEDLFNKKHHNYKLQRDFDKYGATAFKFEILQCFSNQKDMLVHEYQLINSTSKIYNIQKKDYTLECNTNDINGKVIIQRSRVLIVLKKDKTKPVKKKRKYIGVVNAKPFIKTYKRNGKPI